MHTTPITIIPVMKAALVRLNSKQIIIYIVFLCWMLLFRCSLAFSFLAKLGIKCCFRNSSDNIIGLYRQF